MPVTASCCNHQLNVEKQQSLVENYLQLLAIPTVVECFRPNVPRETIQEIYQLSRVMTSSRSLKNIWSVRSGAGRGQNVTP